MTVSTPLRRVVAKGAKVSWADLVAQSEGSLRGICVWTPLKLRSVPLIPTSEDAILPDVTGVHILLPSVESSLARRATTMVFDDALDAQAPTAVTTNPISDGASADDLQAASSFKATWQQIVASKQQAREALLLPEARLQQLLSNPIEDDADLSSLAASLFTDKEAAIIGKPAHILAADIAARRLTSYQVTLTFCKAATIAQDATNCLTEICFREGLAQARSLDTYQAEHDGKTIGPLHGVPVSVKDHIDVKGMDGPSGFVGWCGNCVADTNALAVSCLVEAGAVIYCKTANPQSLLSIETNNNVYGRTTNPHNRTLSPGGSSGGEGALIAMRGSVLGVGTDIAGSIRIPALWSGIYGLRPTIGRLPHSGLRGPHSGMDTILGVVGPLATCLADLNLFCSAIMERQPWRREPQVLTLPWKTELTSPPPDRKLRIGIMLDDGLCAVHPPISRAMNKATRTLKAAGHTLLPWDPILAKESVEVLFTACLQDRGEEYHEHMRLSGEPAVPLLQWLLTERVPSKTLSTPREVWDLNVQRDTIKTAALAQWEQLNLDVLLCPGAPTLAPRHDQSRHWNYTSMWNVTDWPAVTFPIGKHSGVEAPKEEAETKYPPHPPRNPIEEHVFKEWSPEWYRNAPVGLQLVGQRMQEEELLGCLKLVEAALSA